MPPPPEPSAGKEAWVVVCMGVSATGKTSVAEELASQLGVDFEEGDHHHAPASVAKMEAGTPLTDDDRMPWLEELAQLAADHVARGRHLVLTCSALKRSYRDVLRGRAPEGRVYFVHLHGDFDLLLDRMGRRTSHFMPTSLLQDQFDTLEPLGPQEAGCLVDVAPSLADVVADARAHVHADLGLPAGIEAVDREGA